DPAFPPLSRVVTYPDDGNRKALWDPVRPARVFPVESKGKFPGTEPGIVIVPPGSPEAARLPARPPLDPERPKVPVYVPPDPSDPLPPDVTQLPVYVPPGPPEAERSVQSDGFGSSEVPVYVPPAPAEAPE
ncbi:MAG: hypothetical protein LBL51_00195, partial [Synergistaceae bacterium]|nr:hypothetical protein [Synergistaceae bacterium]